MTEATRNVLDIFIRIIFYSGYVAAPIMVLILVMYQYEKYKKWKDKEKKDAERIIVKMNEDIVKTGVAVNVLSNRETELKLSCEAYEARLKALKTESGEDVEKVVVEETLSTEVLNIKQLQALARERGVKGFSRMKKKDLMKILGGSANVAEQ